MNEFTDKCLLYPRFQNDIPGLITFLENHTQITTLDLSGFYGLSNKNLDDITTILPGLKSLNLVL